MSLPVRTINVLRIAKKFPSKGLQAEVRRHFGTTNKHSFNPWIKYLGIAASCGIGYTTWITYRNTATVHAFKLKKKDKDEEFSKDVKLTSRERHFIKFASVEYDGQIYMTPQDFLESFVEEEPRPRLKRRGIANKELDEIKNATPMLRKGSSKLFRALRDKGIISYTEYLFLLSILTKPETGFLIAFNMFDTDGNQKVDKEEFLVILHLLSGDIRARAAVNDEMKQAMEKIFSLAWADKHGSNAIGSNDTLNQNTALDGGQSLQRKNLVDTTLLIHFFGKKGNITLQYEDFRRFMENLQTEVLEMEFQEFAKGGNTINEIDFARILLRYTHLDPKLCNMYLDRLLNRLKENEGIPPGITFPEFKVFCQFLNNLEDFTIAMRMYTLADHPISKEEFHRAVKICTGTSLSKHLVHTVFAIFDEDGDGQLSYREFIAIMKDRLHRGFKSHTKGEGWEAFKTCIKQEIKSPVAR
ncbi:calcium uptake protein 3, mitochondrial isoform X3 [Planococcus citri]|uniref:calcium uptake protein 3, mitochondrial isoform X3 n=1 Tax=Planococcus citri TaxID=170843 RepID=UPI0031F96E24